MLDRPRIVLLVLNNCEFANQSSPRRNETRNEIVSRPHKLGTRVKSLRCSRFSTMYRQRRGINRMPFWCTTTRICMYPTSLESQSPVWRPLLLLRSSSIARTSHLAPIYRSKFPESWASGRFAQASRGPSKRVVHIGSCAQLQCSQCRGAVRRRHAHIYNTWLYPRISLTACSHRCLGSRVGDALQISRDICAAHVTGPKSKHKPQVGNCTVISLPFQWAAVSCIWLRQ